MFSDILMMVAGISFILGALFGGWLSKIYWSSCFKKFTNEVYEQYKHLLKKKGTPKGS